MKFFVFIISLLILMTGLSSCNKTSDIYGNWGVIKIKYNNQVIVELDSTAHVSSTTPMSIYKDCGCMFIRVDTGDVMAKIHVKENEITIYESPDTRLNGTYALTIDRVEKDPGVTLFKMEMKSETTYIKAIKYYYRYSSQSPTSPQFSIFPPLRGTPLFLPVRV